jgi:carbonic anhydrase
MSRKLFVAIMLMSVWSAANAGAHWKYDGSEGPDNWGRLSREYAICASGKNQSPVDVQGAIKGRLKPIAFAYQGNAVDVVNNGLGIQVNYAPGSTITVDNQKFELKQINFHAPGENHIKGKSFPAEMQLVHADKEGNLAIIAVMIKQGASNTALAAIWKKLPPKADSKNTLDDKVNALKLLPRSKAYYRLNGSLTTPPCSEGVRWLLMKSPVMASAEQISMLTSALKGPNSRPLQPLNARMIVE